MSRPRADRSEGGEVLIIVLVIMLALGLVAGVFLSQVQSNFILGNATNVQSDHLYTADGGIEWGINQLKNNSGLCKNNGNDLSNVVLSNSQLNRPSDVSSVTLTCQQNSSSGSNTFGGYAVVAGVTSHGIASNGGSTSCDSLSADPVGGGTPTFAKGNSPCLTYPAGSTPPAWVQQTSTPDTATTLNAVYPLDNSDMWAGGANGPNARVWASDGEEWVDVTGNLAGTTITDIFAITDPGNPNQHDVWAVGQAGGKGTIWYSTNADDDDTGTTWAIQSQQTNPATFTDITGITSPSLQLWAVGTTAGGGGKGYVTSSADGTTWSAATQLGGATAATGLFAQDSTDVWASGTSANKGAVWTYNGAHWSGATTFNNTSTLTDVDGSDNNDVWVIGANAGNSAVSFWNGSAWTSASAVSGANTLSGVFAADPSDIWAVGTAGGNSGTVWFCNGPGCTWTTTGQTLPTTTNLIDVSGLDAQPGDIRAVGANGNVLDYSPPTSTTSCSTGTKCLAQILGGPVFNANALNLASGLFVRDGNFDQLTSTSACPASPSPTRLVMGSSEQYCTMSSIPTSIQPVCSSCAGTLDEPLPSAVPPVASPQAGTTVTPASPLAGCTSYVVFSPGTYNTGIHVNKNTTYFFESGVYNFTAGWGALDNGNTAPDNLYVIGGQPAPNDSVDVNTVAKNSPCWSDIQARNYFAPGSTGCGTAGYPPCNAVGYGVEFILASGTWWDVHTVNLELFTRQGGPASEGAQGISIREVPPVCTTGSNSDTSKGYDTTVCVPTGSGWITSSSGGQDQIFQVDANDHLPNVYIHGGLFVPDNNLEEFTNTSQVTLGPIFANSIEFTYENANVPPLRVSAGAPNFRPETVLTVTTKGPHGETFVVQAVVETDLDPSSGQVTQVQEKSWQLITPAP